MNQKFQDAVNKLLAARSDFETGKLGSVPYRDARESALAQALIGMAEEHGVKLEAPVQVDSNGEFHVNALHESGRPSSQGCGPFGDAFAAALTAHNARTGFPGPNALDADNGWCRLNHFDAERMVLEHFGRSALAGQIA